MRCALMMCRKCIILLIIFLFLIVTFNSRILAQPEFEDTVDPFIMDAIHAGTFPGAVLLVGSSDSVLYHKSYGNFTYDSSAPHVKPNTMFDLASLSKVVATTAAVMHLFDRDKLKPEDAVAKYIPGFTGETKSAVTIRHLLLHTSGLPSWRNYYIDANSREELIELVIQTPLVSLPGERYQYSDLGMILLGKIVERVSGYRLDGYLSRYIYEPLGMKQTRFNPPAEIREYIAPTEIDTVWRKELVHGYVHDENAYQLDGVAGHAGLFSNASDLGVFARLMLNKGELNGMRLFHSETVQLFTERSEDVPNRAYGWGLQSIDGGSSAGNCFSPSSFGHTGFTGTSLWIDPDKDVFVVFLTNRVHPVRANARIISTRPELHDLIMKTLGTCNAEE